MSTKCSDTHSVISNKAQTTPGQERSQHGARTVTDISKKQLEFYLSNFLPPYFGKPEVRFETFFFYYLGSLNTLLDARTTKPENL